MMYRSILFKTFAKIPNTTDEEIGMVVDSITYINELSFRDAVKDMATKADIKDMVIKADIKYLESKMATKEDIRKSENKMLFRIVGLLAATVLVNLSLTGMMLRFFLSS